MKSLKTIVPAMLLLSACAQSKPGADDASQADSSRIVYIDVDQLKAPKYLISGESFLGMVDTFFVVQLEATGREESLIGGISNRYFIDGGMIISVTGMQSSYPVQFFSSDGKFKYAIRNGGGPNECQPFSNFSYDFESRRVIAFNGGHVRLFSLEGKALNDFYLPFSILDVQRQGDDYVIKHNGLEDSEFLRNKRIAVVDSLFNPIAGLCDYCFDVFPVQLANSCFSCSSGVYNYELFRDTISFVKGSSISERLVIKSSNKMDMSQLPEMNDPEWHMKRPKGFIFSTFSQSGNTQYIYISSSEESHQYLRNTASGNVVSLDSVWENAILPSQPAGNGIFLSSINGVYSGHFLDRCKDYLSEHSEYSQYLPIFENFNPETCNPILILARYKEF